MAIDAELAKSLKFPSSTVEVERGRLRFFARAIGETDPIYTDVDAARRAGHRDLPAPPTYIFSLGLETPATFSYLEDLGVDLRRVLHGEQAFEYGPLAYAGDLLSLQDQITDVYEKRGGALEFIVKETTATREGEQIAKARAVVVVRNPKQAA